MKRIFKLNIILPGIILAFAGFISFSIVAQALSEEDIIYPVVELGDCKDKEACRDFCNNPDNIKDCVAFAEKYDLLSKDEIKKAKAVINVGTGPGGCKGKEDCEQFCEDPTNIEACLDFAQKNDLMSSEEIEEGKKVAKALREGASLPGGCKNKSSCEQYCEDPSHMDECLTFAEKAGFMSPGELEEAKKVSKAMASGARPPGNCRGKAQCEEYCHNPDHMEECMDFGVKAGLIPPEEIEQIKKILPLMKQGKMPGGCRGKEECETYCHDESHVQECMDFAVQAGFMTQEDAEKFKKTGGKGPGGCQGKEECESFCNNPANQETCFGFAKEHGLIPEDQLRHLEEGTQMLKEQMHNLPPEVANCLQSSTGTDIAGKIQRGELTPGPEIGDQIRTCFEQFTPRGPEGHDGPPPPGFEGQSPPHEGEDSYPRPPEGFIPPELQQNIPPGYSPSPEEHQQYEQQYREEIQHDQEQEQYKQQYEEQFKQQYEQQRQQYEQSPSGDTQHQIPQEYQQYQQQAPTEYHPPEPTSSIGNKFIGSIINFLLGN